MLIQPTVDCGGTCGGVWFDNFVLKRSLSFMDQKEMPLSILNKMETSKLTTARNAIAH